VRSSARNQKKLSSTIRNDFFAPVIVSIDNLGSKRIPNMADPDLLGGAGVPSKSARLGASPSPVATSAGEKAARGFAEFRKTRNFALVALKDG
jgi:hypothetical protein